MCGLAQPGFNELAQSELQTTVKCSTTFHVSHYRSCARSLTPLSRPRCACARSLPLCITPSAPPVRCCVRASLSQGLLVLSRGWERETVPRVVTRHEHGGHSPAVKHANQTLGLRNLVLCQLPRPFCAHPSLCGRPGPNLKVFPLCSVSSEFKNLNFYFL